MSSCGASNRGDDNSFVEVKMQTRDSAIFANKMHDDLGVRGERMSNRSKVICICTFTNIGKKTRESTEEDVRGNSKK